MTKETGNREPLYYTDLCQGAFLIEVMTLPVLDWVNSSPWRPFCLSLCFFFV